MEVALIDGNEYFVKVFCEHRPGGFVRLMESFNTIGMDVVHATVTSHKGLVSNVFEVEVTYMLSCIKNVIFTQKVSLCGEVCNHFINYEMHTYYDNIL